MEALRTDQKIALILMSLPVDAAESVLVQLGPKHSGRLRAEIQRLTTTPPPQELADAVLQELDSTLHSNYQKKPSSLPRIAPGTGRESRHNSGVATIQSGGASGAAAEGTDPMAQLLATAPENLAVAITDEHPSTAALVLGCLDSEKAGKVLRLLPLELKRNTFNWLRLPAAGNPELLPRIVQAVVQKSRVAAESPVSTNADAKFQKMAEMLRELERADRTEILNSLEQQDNETATRIKDLLYTFEDLLLIENRSMQKLLVEIDSKTMALALKDANPEITEKVMSNLSKRARESLTEEISFLGLVPAAELQQAQKAIVEVIQRLDQTGELVMQQ